MLDQLDQSAKIYFYESSVVSRSWSSNQQNFKPILRRAGNKGLEYSYFSRCQHSSYQDYKDLPECSPCAQSLLYQNTTWRSSASTISVLYATLIEVRNFCSLMQISRKHARSCDMLRTAWRGHAGTCESTRGGSFTLHLCEPLSSSLHINVACC